MLSLLHPEEKILLVIRKHWFVMTWVLLTFFILLAVPLIVLNILPFVTESVDQRLMENTTNFFLALYIMVLLGLLFLTWMDYYLDMWIITSERIIDVDQEGLFNRSISEIPLRSVQDITIEIDGVIETFLKFGTMRIQTAGEREFIISQAPRLYEAKDIILQQARSLVEKK